MFNFSSWTDITEKTKSFLQNLETQTKDFSLKAKTSLQNISTDVVHFIEEGQQEFKQIEQDCDLQRRKKQKKDKLLQYGYPPWHYEPKDKDKTDGQNDQLLNQVDELKLRILKLCEDNNNFLIEAPSSITVFEFNFESALPYANAALKYDPILPEKRYQLVPKKILEEQFWRNYFYRVQLIRESMGFPKLDLITPSQLVVDNINDVNNDHNNQNDNINQEDPVSPKKNGNNQNLVLNKEKKQQTGDDDEGQENNNNANIVSANIDQLETKIVNLDFDNNDNVGNNIHTGHGNESKNKNKKLNKNKNESKHQNHDENEDTEEFLSDDLHIDTLTTEERAKMQKELGIKGNDVDSLLREVNADDNVANISDGEVEKVVSEVENTNI